MAAAAAVLAALGFCVSVAASARGRRGQRALLAALGVPSGAQARLFCLEEIMISGPAALVGLVLGIGLAHLLIPAITLTATAGLPVPPVLVRLPAGLGRPDRHRGSGDPGAGCRDHDATAAGPGCRVARSGGGRMTGQASSSRAGGRVPGS